jgi:hypothetical protein
MHETDAIEPTIQPEPEAPPPRINPKWKDLRGALAALQEAQAIAAGASGDRDPGDVAA